MFDNGKPDIVFETSFDLIKKNSYNFDLKKILKLGIVVLVMFYKMLVLVFIIDFYFGYGPSVSFETYVPCIFPLARKCIKIC